MNINGKEITADDLMAMILDHPEYRLTDTSIILLREDMSGFEYEIEFSRVNNYYDVYDWIRQIARKNWVTKKHILSLGHVLDRVVTDKGEL
jgi:antibiotic biosynthesis monooxygenase (ABM) superfamily enzyme